MEKFAGYGFNKSHAAAYALVAYQTAYFKAHHPSAFMAANLSLVMDDTDKVRSLRDDAIAQGLTILPPDINASNYRFEPVDAKRIRYGLGGVKGTGEAAIEAIVAAREAGGPFRDLFDFCRRIDKRVVNRRADRGARARGRVRRDRPAACRAARVGRHRARRRGARARRAPRRYRCSARRRPGPSVSLVADARLDRGRAPAAREGARSATTCRAIRSPRYAAELAPLTRTTLANLAPRQERVLVAGIVTQMRVQASRRGKMAFVTLDDGHGSAEIMVYNETFDCVRQLLREDQLVIAEVKVMQRMTEDGESQGLRIIAENVYDLATMRKMRAKRLKIACNGNATADDAGGDPRAAPPGRQADHGVAIAASASAATSSCRDDWRVNLDDALIERLREWLSPGQRRSRLLKTARCHASSALVHALRRHPRAWPARRAAGRRRPGAATQGRRGADRSRVCRRQPARLPATRRRVSAARRCVADPRSRSRRAHRGAGRRRRPTGASATRCAR